MSDEPVKEWRWQDHDENVRLAPPREHEIFDMHFADLEAFRAHTEERLAALENAVAEHEMKLRYLGEQK